MIKKYLLVLLPLLLTGIISGLIWRTESAPETSPEQRNIEDFVGQQQASPGEDVKPSEAVKSQLISRWLYIGAIISGMFLLVLLFHDLWDGVRKWHLKKIHRQLDRDR